VREQQLVIEINNERDIERDGERELDMEVNSERAERREEEFILTLEGVESRRDEQLVLVQEAGEEALNEVEKRMRNEIEELKFTHGNVLIVIL
jgi:hypothetical protein